MTMTDKHDDGHGAHAHHVIDAKVYIATGMALLVLTLITVAVSYINLESHGLGPFANIFVAMLVATIKATLVCSFFMGLFYDRRLNAVIFVSSLVFVAFFFLLTFSDVAMRGEVISNIGPTIVDMERAAQK